MVPTRGANPEFFFNLFILWALALRLVLKSDGFM
jgi:hypothetical protein